MPKKIHLLIFLVANISFAQLSVRNSAYIFVDDEIIFVEDDVNLNEANSSIYLRDEGQLIQGTGTTGNSGIGEVSVYQDNNVGAYEYNYWCSPVGNKTNNSTNNPFGITMLNDVTGLITSTPAGTTSTASYNGTSTPLNIEPYWIWKFIASDEYSEWVHVQSATTINPGEGFTMKGTAGSGDNQLYDFRGKPNNGTISVSVLNNQFTLVGNPYPSALDALAYIHDTENAAVINGTLYFWEQDPSVNSHNIRDYDGGYATYTISADGLTETFIPAIFNTYDGDGAVNVPMTGTGSKTVERYIPIGQGFMVEGTATGTVKAKNIHRAYKKESVVLDSSAFFKASNIKSKANDGFSKAGTGYKRFRLNIDFNDTYTRQLVETFHNSATDGFDYGLESKINVYDILKKDAHWIIEDETYLAEALVYNENLKMPLHIRLDEKSNIRIRITDIQNFDSNQPVYIHDIESNAYINLNEQDFSINLNSGNYSNRFEITFTKNQSLSVAENDFETIKLFQDKGLSTLTVSNPKLIKLDTFSLFDITGKQLKTKKLRGNRKEYNVSTKSFSAGIYVVKITMDNGTVFSKKVIISN